MRAWMALLPLPRIESPDQSAQLQVREGIGSCIAAPCLPISACLLPIGSLLHSRRVLSAVWMGGALLPVDPLLLRSRMHGLDDLASGERPSSSARRCGPGSRCEKF